MKHPFPRGWTPEGYKEFLLFVYFCGERDRAFFDLPPQKRALEDHVRLMSIALAFGFKRTFRRMLSNIGSNEELDAYLNGGAVNKETMKAWIEAFVQGIPDPIFRKELEAYWDREKKKVDDESYRLGDFFA